MNDAVFLFRSQPEFPFGPSEFLAADLPLVIQKV